MRIPSATDIWRHLSSTTDDRPTDEKPLRSAMDADEVRRGIERQAIAKLLIWGAIVICLFAVLGRFF